MAEQACLVLSSSGCLVRAHLDALPLGQGIVVLALDALGAILGASLAAAAVVCSEIVHRTGGTHATWQGSRPGSRVGRGILGWQASVLRRMMITNPAPGVFEPRCILFLIGCGSDAVVFWTSSGSGAAIAPSPTPIPAPPQVCRDPIAVSTHR